MLSARCAEIARLFPLIEHIFADGSYAGRKMVLTVCWTAAWRMQVVKRSNAGGLAVLLSQWIVKRILAWTSRNRRQTRGTHTDAEVSNRLEATSLNKPMRRQFNPSIDFTLLSNFFSRIEALYKIGSAAIDPTQARRPHQGTLQCLSQYW